ncbi:diguanylate cyclase domain-containing protein [Pseudokineococcus marinus]|uniref:Diguanylate cyclase n=1 Tax=Pseudokineococcus marinus TaxID=351215 RepID=A0A849BGY9_9ACTN|nr:sensor domain-containing diguanylate cyclase [Pseudokineococcus marinus]NNH22379.1 diguanylate cyclase [Pseudokineococcus marinus]
MTSTPADPAPVAAASRPGGWDAAALVGWCALVALAVAVGRSTRVEGTELSLVGPVAAVTFLACLAARHRGAVALGGVTLLVGGISAATNLVLGAAPALALAFGAAHAVHGLVAAVVHEALRRGRTGGAPPGPADRRALHEPADLTALVASALAGSAASALVGPVYLAAADGAPLLSTAGEWVLRNVASTVVLAGAVLALGDRRRARRAARRAAGRAGGGSGGRPGAPLPRAGRAELVLLQVGAWSVYALVYVVLAEVPVSYATLPLSLLLALRSSPAHAAVHSVVAGVVVVLGTLAGHGPFAMLEPGLRVVVAQGFVVVAASAAMALALYRCQRDELLDGLARAQAAADDRAELLRKGFDDAPAGMALVDLALVHLRRAAPSDGDGGQGATLRVANAAFGAFLGVPAGSLAGTPVDHLPAEHEGPGTCALDAVAAGAERATCEHVTAHGRRGRLDVTRITPRHSRPYLLVSVEDVTAQRRLEAALRHRADHDELTGLPGREVLTARLRRALEREGSRDVGVLFVDLDGFKAVNDTAGHAAGDALLRVVATRLAAAVRPDDVVARFGGDEFAVLCHDVASPAALVAVGARVVRALEEPVVLEGGAHLVGASVGACATAGTAPGTGAEEVLRRADAAMYEAKRAGRGRVRLDGAQDLPQPRRSAEVRPPEGTPTIRT